MLQPITDDNDVSSVMLTCHPRSLHTNQLMLINYSLHSIQHRVLISYNKRCSSIMPCILWYVHYGIRSKLGELEICRY